MDDKMTDAKHQPSKPAAVAGSSGPRRLTTSRIVAVAAAASLLVGLIAGPIIANHFTSAAGTPGTSNAPSASAAATDTTGTPEHTDEAPALLRRAAEKAVLGENDRPG